MHLFISLSSLDMLQTLGLRDNRLTSASITLIFDNLRPHSLRHIDLSNNNFHGEASAALGRFLSSENAVHCIEIAKANIDCADMKLICKALCSRPQSIHELNLSQNKIRHNGAAALGGYLSQNECSLVWLDMSWNELGVEGGTRIADALAINKSLTCLDLAANSFRDEGAQQIAASMLLNKSLHELSLAQNAVGEKACFVFSKVFTLSFLYSCFIREQSMQKLKKMK